MEKVRGGACNNQHTDFGKLGSYPQCSDRNHNSSFAFWQYQIMGADLPNLDPQIGVLPTLEPGWAMSKVLSHSLTHCQKYLLAVFNQKEL